MKKWMKRFTLAATLTLCFAQTKAIFAATGGTLSGTVAEYNAALVRQSNGQLTVPANLVTYTANTAIPEGSTFYVTLPTGFSFTSSPTLTSSAASFSLSSLSGGTAKFVVESADVAAGQTIALGGYRIKGATALKDIIPAGAALSLTMQAVGVDAQPVAFGEFASDAGIMAQFAGNSVIIDMSAPSNGRRFYNTATSSDTQTATLGAVTIKAKTADYSSIPVLNPDGDVNALSAGDRAILELPGLLFSGFSVYASSDSNCATVKWQGVVQSKALVFANLPINKTIYLCARANGAMVKMIGYPNGETTLGLNVGILANPSVWGDFLSSGNVTASSNICYTKAPSASLHCEPAYYEYYDATPATISASVQ